METHKLSQFINFVVDFFTSVDSDNYNFMYWTICFQIRSGNLMQSLGETWKIINYLGLLFQLSNGKVSVIIFFILFIDGQ